VLIRTRLVLCCFLGFASFLAAANPPANSYIIQTVAGSDFAADGPSALAAIFSQTEGIAIDSSGTIYIADADDNRVRKINPNGSIQTVAGTGVAGFAGDGGSSNTAMLSHPYGVVVDAQGNLYIADLGNGRVRRTSSGGTIATVAGGGTIAPGGNGDGGPATSVQLLEPRNIAVTPDGTLYISDFGAHRVYRITPGGILTTLAGTGSAGFSGDGGASQLAQLNSPAGLAFDSTGALYIADSANNRIRRVYQGIITTVYNVTGPTGIAISPTGALYIAASGYLGTQFKAIGGIPSARDVTLDRSSNVYATTDQYVYKVTSSGTVTTVAGSGAEPYFAGDNGAATAARLHGPFGLAVDDAGNWYIADTANNRIRKITPASIITTIAGTGDAGSKGDNGSATLAQLNGPRSVACDSQHNIYIADSGNNSIRKITPGGVIQTVAVQLGVPLNDPQYVATDSQDSLYIADAGNGRVLKVTSSGLVSIVMLVLSPFGSHGGWWREHLREYAEGHLEDHAGRRSQHCARWAKFAARVGRYCDRRPDCRRHWRECCSQTLIHRRAFYYRWNGRRWLLWRRTASLHCTIELAGRLGGGLIGNDLDRRFREQSPPNARALRRRGRHRDCNPGAFGHAGAGAHRAWRDHHDLWCRIRP
jgi:sugar lactone lactonase YvrE